MTAGLNDEEFGLARHLLPVITIEWLDDVMIDRDMDTISTLNDIGRSM